MRLCVTCLCLLALAGFAYAEDIRIEVGLGGVFPAGGWTHCRITGLDDVKDGSVLTVSVSEMFEARMKVSGGIAEGFVLMPDESPAITIEIPGRGRVALPAEAARRLHAVKDRLPVMFLGENPPDEADVRKILDMPDIFPIRMSVEEFPARPLRDFEWVRVFVLGKMSDGEVKQLRKSFSHFSNSVLVARSGDLTGWIGRLAFKDVVDLSVFNGGLAGFLPLPRGSVRPEFYEIFGPPEWPKSVRRNLAIVFVGCLGVFAICIVFPGKKKSTRVCQLVAAAVFAVFFTFIARGWTSNPTESVSLCETQVPSGKGVETTVISKAVLRRGGRANLDPVAWRRVAPVASHPRQWVEHKLVLDETGELKCEAPVGSREVFVKYRHGRVPLPVEGSLRTDGDNVAFTEVTETSGLFMQRSSVVGRTVSFAEYVGEPRHPDARVDKLRRAMLRYWRKRRFRKGTYSIGWTAADTEGITLNAGTMVVVRKDR